MTWLYVPSVCATDTEASSLDSGSPGSMYEPWLVLSGTATRRPCSWRGWKRRPWIRRLFGTISSPSMAVRGVAEWISSLPVSPVSRSRKPASSEVSMMSDGSGRTLPGSWLRWDRSSCSWRTSPDLFDLEGSSVSAGILPRSGSMRNGVCSPRPPLVPLIDASDSGSWPTPVAGDAKSNGNSPEALARGFKGTLTDRAVRMWGTPLANDIFGTPESNLQAKANMASGPRSQPTSLTVQAKMWPTPAAKLGDDRRGVPSPETGQRRLDEGRRNLDDMAATWPTPKTTDAEAAAPADLERKSPGLRALTTVSAGSDGEQRADLNPRFVAALMGVPWDWLNPCISVETGSFREWLRTHSLSSSPDSRTAA